MLSKIKMLSKISKAEHFKPFTPAKYSSTVSCGSLTNKTLSQADCHSNQTRGFILFAVSFASLMPSLKSTTPICLEILLNQYSTVLKSEFHDVIRFLICMIQKR